MDTPIDKLVFALGGDVTALMDAFKQAEAASAKSGTTMQANLGKAFQDAAGQVQKDAGAIKGAMSGVEDHVGRVSSHIQVSRREMVYAFRELLNGDLQRLPATLGLLLSHMLEISPAAIAVGAAVSAIPLGIAVSAVKADQALAKLRTSIALTGNASGISVSQATSAAAAAASASGGTLSTLGAERVMGGFIGAGVPRSLSGKATLAVGNYALGSGSSQADSTSMLARALMEPVKGAQELNKTMHLLTYQQTEEVRQLEEKGQKEAAAAIILGEFAARAKEAADNASLWDKTLDYAGNKLGEFAHGIAVRVGAGSKQDRLNQLLYAPMYQPVPGLGHGAAWTKEVADLRAGIAKDDADAQKKGRASKVDDDLSSAFKEAAVGSNAYAMRLDNLKNKTEAAGTAAQEAADKFGKNGKDTKTFLDSFHAQSQAFAAVKEYGAPGMAEARQLGYARQLAGTPLDKEAIVRARQEANEARIREKMDPSTTLQADANYKARMATAGLADADKLKQQQKRLEGMQAEAVGAGKIAAAYDVSTAAVARATAESEVDVEITNKQINAKDRLTAVQTKLNTAFDQARQAIGKLIDQAGIENAATRMELAAGGNPLALMHATASAGAFRDTENALRLASSPAERADILSHRGRLADSNYAAAQMDAQKAAQGTLFGANADLAGQRRLYSAQTSGMSDDDLRRFQVWNQLVQEFTKQGLDPADRANRKLFEDTLKTNTALSDLGDEMQKTAEEAKGLADDITGGIGNFLRNPTMNPKDALAGIGQDMLSTIVKSNILDPMNKFLTSQFSSAIGGPGALGSSPANAMYVQWADIGGGAPGGGGGAGGILGTLGKVAGWFGGGDTSGIMSTIAGGDAALSAAPEISGLSSVLDAKISGDAFAGMPHLAGGGPTRGGRTYLVGENGPELWNEGASGYMTPAPMVRAALGSQSGQGNGGDSITNNHFHLPGVTDVQTFVRSKSQIAAAATAATSQGKRNH